MSVQFKIGVLWFAFCLYLTSSPIQHTSMGSCLASCISDNIKTTDRWNAKHRSFPYNAVFLVGKPESSDSFACYFLMFQPPKRCRTSTPGNSDTLLQDGVPLVLDLRLALVSNFPDIDAIEHPKDGPEEALKTQPIIIRLQMIHYPSARVPDTTKHPKRNCVRTEVGLWRTCFFNPPGDKGSSFTDWSV